MNILADELLKFFPRVEPLVFYRDIFPDGELDEVGAFTPGKYMGIAIEILGKDCKDGRRPLVHRFSVGNDLAVVDALLQSDGFCILAPISYAGKTRDSKRARFMYALVVELDNLVVRDGRQQGLYALINQWGGEYPYLPRPTYVVASGNGVHLYYVFSRPVALFQNVVKGLADFKRALTRMIWNRKTTVDYSEDRIQFESVFQAFRMVGTRTKSGDVVQAFRSGTSVTIEYLNSFVSKIDAYKDCLIPVAYKSDLRIDEAKKRYPEWYQERIVEKRPKGKWDYSRQKGHRGDEIYLWWLHRIRTEAAVGHRYYCLMMLAIYAIKCDIDEDRLIADLYELLPIFEDRTVEEDNHFTQDDVVDALQAFYDKGLYTYPVSSIENRSGLEIRRNKRNGRKRMSHIAYMNLQRAFKVMEGECSPGGRPSKEVEVIEYISKHPWESKSEIARNLKISRPTVMKYWNDGLRVAWNDVVSIIDNVLMRKRLCEDSGMMEKDELTGKKMDDEYWRDEIKKEFNDLRLYEWYLTVEQTGV
jgi:hypothetical protein